MLYIPVGTCTCTLTCMHILLYVEDAAVTSLQIQCTCTSRFMFIYKIKKFKDLKVHVFEPTLQIIVRQFKHANDLFG